MERSRGDKEEMIRLDRTVLRNNGRSLHDRQNIPLDTLARYIRTRTVSVADGDLIDLIKKHDTAVFRGIYRLVCNDIHIDKFIRLFGGK